MLGGVGGQGSRPAGVTAKVRFTPPVYAGGGNRGAHIPGTIPDIFAPPVPGSPEASAGAAESGIIDFFWDALQEVVEGVFPYQWRWDISEDFSSPTTSEWISDNTVQLEIAEDDVEYFFQVRARDESQNTSAWSTAVSATIDSEP